ncbi:MAG TPA: hypothetical protein VFF15_02885, partial [Flavobacteriaceae bacterium]|nr:hypothetical protein [Flavobacteriaceae bacterium]
VSNETRTKPPQNTSPEAPQRNPLQQCHIELVEMPAKTSFNSQKTHLPTHFPTHRETGVMLNSFQHLFIPQPIGSISLNNTVNGKRLVFPKKP